MMQRPFLVATVLLFAWPLTASAAEAASELRVACVQMEVTPDLRANLERIERGITEAKDAGARVVLFPEGALSGFEKKTIEGLDWEALENAMRRLAQLTRSTGMYVLYGTATRSGKARPFNSAVLVGPDGEEVTRYHKMVPEDWFEPGDHLALFKIDGVPCTLIICHDIRMPELVRLPVLRGALICFQPSYAIDPLPAAVRKIENYRAQLIARATENNIWVVQANGFGPLDTPNRVAMGHSRIVDPLGVIVDELPGLQDAMLVETVFPAAATRRNALQSLGIKRLE